ncbi:hypothetical protein [Photorhabdus khanii]|uniref:Uncharacterized protein n=1 Tax=Photorhabdus khanii subsp. guanajuatensis TaxID=2100166 RepID=A0A4R4K194_9GAMM|nr:hypothetical protein [Photorhabdus khanii]TDB60998.1 hypothetical protein C5467_05430 [Photorhabdus khanii subsp. guanajuatensis]
MKKSLPYIALMSGLIATSVIAEKLPEKGGVAALQSNSCAQGYIAQIHVTGATGSWGIQVTPETYPSKTTHFVSDDLVTVDKDAGKALFSLALTAFETQKRINIINLNDVIKDCTLPNSEFNHIVVFR